MSHKTRKKHVQMRATTRGNRFRFLDRVLVNVSLLLRAVCERQARALILFADSHFVIPSTFFDVHVQLEHEKSLMKAQFPVSDH